MSDYFPPELIVETLHRLPFKSLVKCMSVCKAWKSLITNDTFISDHLTRTLHLQANHGNSSLFLQFFRMRSGHEILGECYSLYSDDKETHSLFVWKFPLTHLFRMYGYSTVVGTCNGLVCLADYSIIDSAIAVIWNPSIQKYVILPKPILTFKRRSHKEKSHRVFFGFGFDCRNKDFKVVRFVTLQETEATPQVEIYSLASRSWRTITSTTTATPAFLLSKHCLKPSQMFVNGKLHWVVTRRNYSGIHYYILTLDVVEEKFGELMLPQCLNDSSFQVSIFPGGNTLAVLQESLHQNYFNIWVMKEYCVVESWIQLLHFDTTSGRPNVLALTSIGQVVLVFYHDEIVLLDPKTQLRTKLKTFMGYCNIFAGDYVNSLYLAREEFHIPTLPSRNLLPY